MPTPSHFQSLHIFPNTTVPIHQSYHVHTNVVDPRQTPTLRLHNTKNEPRKHAYKSQWKVTRSKRNETFRKNPGIKRTHMLIYPHQTYYWTRSTHNCYSKHSSTVFCDITKVINQQLKKYPHINNQFNSCSPTYRTPSSWTTNPQPTSLPSPTGQTSATQTTNRQDQVTLLGMEDQVQNLIGIIMLIR